MPNNLKKTVWPLVVLSLVLSMFLPIQAAFAINDIPTAVNGRVLSTSKSGDSSEWIEIAQNDGYSLILRKDAVQNSGFGSTSQYANSTARTNVNNWFNNTLSSGARLRDFTVQHNATSQLGSWTNTGSGFSKPSTTAARTGNDVAFLLSFAEAAAFCSTQYASSSTNYTLSSAAATANFNKLTPISGPQPTNHWWLRSSGGLSDRVCTVGLGGFNNWGTSAMNGAVNQYQISSNIIKIRPALWVGSGIFDDLYTLTYNANGGSGAPPAQTAPANTNITLSSVKPQRLDNDFLGWATTATATTAQYQPGALFNIGAGHKTLYAVWKKIDITRTITGFVWPMVTNDKGLGESFLRKHDVVVELRSTFRTPAAAALSTKAVLVDASEGLGKFTFENVPFGTYVLYIKRPGYLARAMMVTVSDSSPPVIELAPPSVVNPPPNVRPDNGVFRLWWGDCSDDRRVDNQDIMMIMELMQLMVNAFSPLYDPACDLNADGLIDNED
ncbi:MAG: InlB B-repeat-containing protein, partial [Clostridiales bacterium]|nr:InlB B-repeat-containing protein [Clostridiales bacterium]